jgi:hypothetical protein
MAKQKDALFKVILDLGLGLEDVPLDHIRRILSASKHQLLGTSSPDQSTSTQGANTIQ